MRENKIIYFSESYSSCMSREAKQNLVFFLTDKQVHSSLGKESFITFGILFESSPEFCPMHNTKDTPGKVAGQLVQLFELFWYKCYTLLHFVC